MKIDTKYTFVKVEVSPSGAFVATAPEVGWEEAEIVLESQEGGYLVIGKSKVRGAVVPVIMDYANLVGDYYDNNLEEAVIPMTIAIEKERIYDI